MYADAETLYRTTIEANPVCWMAYNNLAGTLDNRGRVDEAVIQYQKALEIKPDFADPHYNLGLIQQRRGRLEEAIADYQQALEIKPDFANAHNNLGVALQRRGRTAEAIAHLQTAVEIQPALADAHNNLGLALADVGRLTDAIAHYHKALQINPDDTGACNNLAWLRATSAAASFRNGAEAVELAQRAVQLSDGADPNVLETLAAAYAETGQFPKAIAVAERAISLASARGDKALADTLRLRIKLYQAGSPYHETPHQHRK
jgi:Flp pilus assembly protein TadD